MRRWDDDFIEVDLDQALGTHLVRYLGDATRAMRLRSDHATTVFLPPSAVKADGRPTLQARFALAMSGLDTHIAYLDAQAWGMPESYFSNNQRSEFTPDQRARQNNLRNTIYR